MGLDVVSGLVIDSLVDSTQIVFVLKLLLAALLGGIIGFEREKKVRPAGLRTHMLVCMGSTIFTIMSFAAFQGAQNEGLMAAGIVTGIGFIGAGTILHVKNQTYGLTTAASLWLTAAIGVTVATGYYLLGIVATLVGLLVLSLKPLENNIHKRFESLKSSRRRR